MMARIARKTLLIATAAAAAAVLNAGIARQAASDETIHVIVGAAAGGVLDPYARITADHMSKTLGRTIIVENKPGANGNIAAQMVVDAPADGNMIWLGTQSMTEINPSVFSNLRWSMKDFVPIIKGVGAPLILVTHPSVPAKTLEELVAWARKNPGKLNYASFSPGTPSHFLGYQLNEKFGLDLAHVPFRGSGPQTTALVAGHSLLGFAQLGNVMQHLETGKLNAIAITSAERSRFLPDVATFAELGHKDFTTTVWFGMFVRAGTPDAIVKAYVDAAKAAHKAPEVRKSFEKQGFDVLATTGQQVVDEIKEQTARWARLVKATGFKVN